MFLRLVFLLLAVTSSLCSSRPHIVFILADDMVSIFQLLNDQSFISGVFIWNIYFDEVTDSNEVKKLIHSITAVQADTLQPEELILLCLNVNTTSFQVSLLAGYIKHPNVDVSVDSLLIRKVKYSFVSWNCLYRAYVLITACSTISTTGTCQLMPRKHLSPGLIVHTLYAPYEGNLITVCQR
jgi:hypothetical protein